MIHDRGDILRLGLLVVTGIRMRRQAHAAQIGHDDRMVLDQHLGQRFPHIAAIAKAMQQHDRRALAADADMQGSTIRGDFFGMETGGKRLDLGGSRQGQARGGTRQRDKRNTHERLL